MFEQFSSNSMKDNLVFRIRSIPNFSRAGINLELNKFGMSIISSLEKNSPSERSGLMINDIILKVNDEYVYGERLARINNLINKSYRNGSVKLEISRVALLEPITPYFDPKQPRMITINRKKNYENMGFELKYVEYENRYFALNVHKDLVAYRCGLRENDNILEINGTKIYQMNNEYVNDFVESLDKEIDLLVVTDLNEYNRIVKNASERYDQNFNSNPKKKFSQNKENLETKIYNLVRSHNYDGFGFSIRSNELSPQAIAYIEPNSPSEKAGLKENDLILKINEKNVSDIGYSQLLLILQNESKKKSLKLEIQRPHLSLSEKNSLSDNSHCFLNKSLNSSVNSINPESIENEKNKISYYNIKRYSNSTSLGIKLGLNGMIDLVVPNSLADKAGMKKNQRIVEINGIDYTDKTNEEIFNFIKDKKEIYFGIVYEINEDEEQDEEQAEDKTEDDKFPNYKRCVIQIISEYPEGFGFTLNSKIKPKFSIFSVDPDSPAYAANLRPTDVIIQINQINIRKLNSYEVKSMLMESKNNGQVEITALEKSDYLDYKYSKKKIFKNLFSKKKKQFDSENNNSDSSILHLCEFTKFEENLGFVLASFKSKPGLFKAVEVKANSPAYMSGLREGDIIVQVCGTKADNLTYEELLTLVKRKKEERDLNILVKRV